MLGGWHDASLIHDRRDRSKQLLLSDEPNNCRPTSSYIDGGQPWTRTRDPLQLERKIEQATRIVSRVTDQTTYQRLTAWVEELKQKLRQRLAARRTKEEIRARAHELWEQHGRPVGRDLEFWLQAESEKRKGE
ncbi:DUF2934 domain-containing protein [Bradyrhizobium sp. AUGA SZCCT0182]|uniref:DUF2934 domain-containing protein n=1 Tax=Bradyrhizobium sp. AUGA SZCCT0182 TaxID=2807667 RepID=UPI00289AEEA7|nr:DUF2934 domain-containing protein [Bradyrhizobium sp. AUGA SZCCT0182]